MTCENCGKDADASHPDDPDIMGVVVCSTDCAGDLAPLPTGYSFVVAGE